MNQVIEFKPQSKIALLPVTKSPFAGASAWAKVKVTQDGWVLSPQSRTAETNFIRKRRSLRFPPDSLHWLAMAFGSLYLLGVLALSVAILLYTFSG